jgi:DNA-binding transcriptional LysR family regulator
MNIKQLRFAARVAETHSFSRAAELCYATQPTLSNAISQLEDELGGRLFNRTTRHVEVTPFGEYMLPRIMDVLQSLDELTRTAEAYHNPVHKILRIGFSPLVDMQRLNQILTPFRQQYPGVTIFFKECFLDDLEQRLNRGQIDVQILPNTRLTKEENTCLFYRDALYYLPAAEDSQTANHLSFKITDLPATPIILTGGGCGLNAALSSLFKSRGVDLHAYTGQALTYQIIEDWASLGIGAGILPKAKISPDNPSKYPLFIEKDQPAYLTFKWSWLAENIQSDYLKFFVEYIRDTVPSLVAGSA